MRAESPAQSSHPLHEGGWLHPASLHTQRDVSPLSCPARAPRGDLHIPGDGVKQNCPPAEPGSAGSSLAWGVPSQAGEKTQASAPRKQLPPGSLPIFQAYLQATARQRMSLMCSATRKRGNGGDGRWNNGLTGVVLGSGTPGWGQTVAAQGAAPATGTAK